MARLLRFAHCCSHVEHMTTSTEKAVLDWLAARRDAMLDLLRTIVDIDSGSYDKAEVDAVGAQLCRFLSVHGVPFSIIPNDQFGDADLCRTLQRRLQPCGRTGAPARPSRHRLSRRRSQAPPVQNRRRRGSGPGCCDMKAGLAMNAFVLAAFAHFAAAPSPITALFTADEEIGSPSSRELIKAEAQKARAVFNSEPGRPGGGIVTDRKGGALMRLDVEGKAAHAGNNLADGVGAIEEIARKIIKLHALTDLAKGISCNVGTIRGRPGRQHGGAACKRRAPTCASSIPEDGVAAMQAIQAIIAEQNVPGTHARLEVAGRFEPLVASPASQRLFTHYSACAAVLGQNVEGLFAGGCANSGFAASAGAPTICAVGPIGGRAHSPEEYVEVDSIVPRAPRRSRFRSCGCDQNHQKYPTVVRRVRKSEACAPLFPALHFRSYGAGRARRIKVRDKIEEPRPPLRTLPFTTPCRRDIDRYHFAHTCPSSQVRATPQRPIYADQARQRRTREPHRHLAHVSVQLHRRLWHRSWHMAHLGSAGVLRRRPRHRGSDARRAARTPSPMAAWGSTPTNARWRSSASSISAAASATPSSACGSRMRVAKPPRSGRRSRRRRAQSARGSMADNRAFPHCRSARDGIPRAR